MTIRRLIMLLWLPSVAFAQQSYYGTTAVGINLSADGNPADLDGLSIKVGDVITVENVRLSIQTLFDTGRYRSIEVEAVASGNGTQLTFNVVRHIFFSTFQLLPENLLDRALSTLVRLPIGQRFSEERVQEIAEETKQVLREAGYFNAEVTPVVFPDTDPHLRRVELLAMTGPRARIGQIVIQGGGQVFPESKIRDDLKIKTGHRYSLSEIDKGDSAIRTRFSENAYVNTKVEATEEYDATTNTVRLTVTIDPGQRTVIEIVSTAPGKIDEEEIRKLLPIFEEGVLDEDLLQEGRDNIVEYLQQKGYFEAVVEEIKVVPSVEGRPTRITVSIDPGEQHTVNSVRFVGNTVFTDKELKARIKVRAKSLFGFLNHGLFSEELAKRDVSTIQAMYRLAGYEQAFVTYKADDPGTHEIDVTFEITENRRFNIQSLAFVGNDSIPEADLQKAIAIKEGDPYSPSKAEEARMALTRLYYKEGFPDARVEASADTSPETRNKTVTYRISEGPRYRIVQILVAGNTKTAEKVIKRTSGLKEYDWYDVEKVLDAQQKLYATGLFRHVEIVPLDLETGERRTVLIEVEEAKHILVVPGVGVREYAGPLALLDVSHSNMFGLNQTLTFRFRIGTEEQQFQTSYRQPRLFNHDNLEGIATVTIGNVNQKSYESNGVDFAIQARKLLSAKKTFSLFASYQNIDLTKIKASDVVRRNADLTGIVQIARLGASFIRDTRDDVIDPKKGSYSISNLQIASRIWGSEVNFLSFFNQTTYQKTPGVGTLAMSGRVGFKIPYGQTPEVPINERYFAGGSMTLRGFGLDEAGPPGGGGGQLLTIGNVEYRVPLIPTKLGQLGGVLFYDTGNVYEIPSDFTFRRFTHSAGTGLRLLTPLGVVRFDMGFNLNRKIQIENGKPFREGLVHVFFTLGQMF